MLQYLGLHWKQSGSGAMLWKRKKGQLFSEQYFGNSVAWKELQRLYLLSSCEMHVDISGVGFHRPMKASLSGISQPLQALTEHQPRPVLEGPDSTLRCPDKAEAPRTGLNKFRLSTVRGGLVLSVRSEVELPTLCPLALTIQTVWLSTHPLSSSHPRNRPLILTLSKPLYCVGAHKRKIFFSFLF